MKTAFRALTMMSAMSIVLLLGNCSKDGDGDPVPDDVIVGKWTASTTANVTVTVGSQSLVDFLISEDGKTPEQAQNFAAAFEADYYYELGRSIEFKNDGTFFSQAQTWGGDATGTWELSSDRKTLTLKTGTYESVFTVATLTSDNLVVTTDFTYNYKDAVFSMHLEIALTK